MWCLSEHFKKTKTINANANLFDAADQISEALAGGFGNESILQEGELVSA